MACTFFEPDWNLYNNVSLDSDGTYFISWEYSMDGICTHYEDIMCGPLQNPPSERVFTPEYSDRY